ncbi:MAG: glutathione S-transferase family protein, partial [Stellaceae bacterium]
IMLEETGLAYKPIYVDVWNGDQFKPEFLKLNPNGKIPVIVDRDGPGGRPYTCFESGAILLYLAEKAGKFLPEDRVARFEAIQWLMIQMTGVGPMFGQFVHFKRFAPAGNDYAMSRYRTEVLRLYDLIETRLGEQPYLGGAQYTIADIATFPWTRQHDFMGAGFEGRPNFRRWFETIAARPPVKAALAKVETIPSVREHAKPEDVDRFFGRGNFARAS